MTEPLVLLPGMMCDARLFWPQIVEFGKDRAVMVAPLTGATTIAALAAQVLDAAPRRFALAGHCMGGIVAMEMMRRAPERVARLALMDSSALTETPQVAASREPQIVAVRAGRLSKLMRDELGPRSLAPGPNRADALDLFVEMAESLGPETFIAQSRALQRRPDQQKVLGTIRVPTLVLCGRHDTLCPVMRHEFMAGLIPNARLTILETAAHMPTLEAPRATNAALRDWLQNVGSAR